MKNYKGEKKVFRGLFVLFLSCVFNHSFSQHQDSTAVASRFAAAVTVTTKGISTIPNLTLGKPAIIFDGVMGRKLTFEPQLRFALEGKPWTFIFWWRYSVANTQKFRINIGVHPAVAFSTVTDTTSDVFKEYLRADRYLAGEFSPVYMITKNISAGIYYLYSRGLDKHITRNTHLLAFRTGFSNIRISDRVFIRINPQVYYLNLDEFDGYYFNSTLAVAIKNFPLSFSSLVNKAIQTNIPFGEDFLWNASLIYTFSKEFVEKK